jgi:beta-lactamase regulating signal transducer with metallopeptidase domain
MTAVFANSSSAWLLVGAPLANHLWQSTLFVIAVWLLTLLLRKNQAQTRYALWFAASLKFLLPFSLLVILGTHLASPVPPAARQTGFVVAMRGINEPFAPANVSHIVLPPDVSPLAFAARVFPMVILILWFLGFLAVQFHWWRRLRCITNSIQGSAPASSGREYDALQRIRQTMRLTQDTALVFSDTSMEPGILGALRPALLLPKGIADCLTDEQLEVIIRHELCHVLRRDNLVAGLHMFVESVFWFHPFTWWIGARLIAERERACDEQVLQLGSDPHIYAQGILKVCEFYLESPLPCAAGVTGANLKKRIEAIMTNRTPLRLSFAHKFLLSTAALLALTVPLVFGALHASASHASSQSSNMKALLEFSNISIRPNTSTEQGPTILYGHDSFSAENISLRELISESYAVQHSQIIGPGWLNSAKYDVNATVDSSALPEFRKLGADQQRLMLQPLLSERFKLATHRETRVMPVYALVIAQGGSHLRDRTTRNAPENQWRSGLTLRYVHVHGRRPTHRPPSSPLATGGIPRHACGSHCSGRDRPQRQIRLHFAVDPRDYLWPCHACRL